MPQRCTALLAAALAITSVACSATPLSARYRILDAQPDGTPLTRRVLLVADNQIHYLYGDPYWMRTELIDKIVPVAIRPVQLDLFGLDLLRWTVFSRGERAPIIHLGDVLDLGCGSEFEAFVDLMRPSREPWVVAPGNHDGYFAGNLGTGKEWEGACKEGGGAVNKARYVALYLRALADETTDEGCKALRQGVLFGAVPDRGDFHYQGPARPFLRRVAWRIDRSSPWLSYVVQEVDLQSRNAKSGARAILLDTAQYDHAPSFPRAAGVVGDVLSDQQAMVRRWIAEEPRGELTVVTGHHPFGDVSSHARDFIDGLRRRDGAVLYVSAHTHAGQYFVRGSGDDTWLELNVGSIVDWPPEYRTLQFIENRGGQRVTAITPLGRIADDLLESGDHPLHCDPAWEAKPNDEDYYLSYREHASPLAGASQRLLVDVMLAAFRRLIATTPTRESRAWPPGARTDAEVIAAIDRAIDREKRAKVPEDDKLSLLRALDRFERERVPEDKAKHAAFRLCQALWASKYEHLGARKPLVQDWYFDFPRR